MAEEWHAKVTEKKLNTCKHYNGTVNSQCRAGVNYEQLAEGSLGMMRRLPCWATSPFKDAEEIKTCTSREFPTPEEVAAELEEITASLNRTVTARQTIMDYLKAEGKPKRNVAGRIPCPICKIGTLGFSIAYNGHCHATCSTQGCVRWME